MFEDQQDVFDELLESNEKFRQLHERHRSLHDQVEEAEIGVAPKDGFTLDRMKKEKLHLKDMMAAMIRQHAKEKPLAN